LESKARVGLEPQSSQSQLSDIEDYRREPLHPADLDILKCKAKTLFLPNLHFLRVKKQAGGVPQAIEYLTCLANVNP
jgi:hypothetical protein